MADRKFPGPYIDSVKRDDSVMKYVESFDTMGIGARNSGLPKGADAPELKIRHVGDMNSKT